MEREWKVGRKLRGGCILQSEEKHRRRLNHGSMIPKAGAPYRQLQVGYLTLRYIEQAAPVPSRAVKNTVSRSQHTS